MAKFYLIRRNLESFVGPMTLAEMKEAYKRMQFGLQDEVSGHCGPWVSFDNVERVKKHYPEVARIVNEDMLAGWGVSHPEPIRLDGGDTKRIDTRSQKGVALALAFFVIAVVAFAAAVYVANNSKMSGKLKDPAELVPEEAQGYVDRNQALEFDQFMTANMAEIVARIGREKTRESPWLPYVRRYAFQREGTVDGLAPKVLRGNGAASAPIDCSLRTWRKRWRASLRQWPQMVQERKLVRAHWARLVAWDPHWVRRRDNKGWLGGENYYVGCLAMADKALGELATDTSLIASTPDWAKLGYEKVRGRLGWVYEVALSGSSSRSSAPALDNHLSLWSCFEAAKDAPALAKCREAMGQEADPWQDYNEERYGWNLLRLTLAVKGPLAEPLQTALAQQSGRMTKGDFFTRFDYRAELKLLRALAKQTGPVEKVVEKAQAEFPDVRLSH